MLSFCPLPLLPVARAVMVSFSLDEAFLILYPEFGVLLVDVLLYLLDVPVSKHEDAVAVLVYIDHIVGESIITRLVLEETWLP